MLFSVLSYSLKKNYSFLSHTKAHLLFKLILFCLCCLTKLSQPSQLSQPRSKN